MEIIETKGTLNIIKNFNDKEKNRKKEKDIKTKEILQKKIDKNNISYSKANKKLTKDIYYNKGIKSIKINSINKIINVISLGNSFKNIIFLVIFIIFIQKVTPDNNSENFESNFSKITLKINGLGNKKVFSVYFQSIYYPNTIYINGEKQLTINFSYYFNQTDNIVELIWNNSINSCYYMFYQCSDIVEIDLSNFNTSKVTNMDSMFRECIGLSLLNLSNIDTSIVTNMSYMFCNCSCLLSLDLSNFDTSSVRYMHSMFRGCSALSSLNLFNFNISKVTSIGYMFSGCSGLSSLDLSNFDTSSVTYMSYIFSNCSGLSSLNLSNFNTSKVKYMGNIFFGCFSLSSLNLSNFDTSLITNMRYMFCDCSNLSSLDLSNFNTSKVVNMRYMFYGCSGLSSLYLNNFDTSLVTDIHSMFRNCSRISFLDLSNFDTSKVTRMSHMFGYCSDLSSLDLSNFNTSLVTNMGFMFHSCTKLSTLNLSNFNTSNVISMSYMFCECSMLSSLDLSNFDTSKAKEFGHMFYNCSNIIILDLSNFDTSLVTDMSFMFRDCSKITSLDLSNFDTSLVINMRYMFRGCSNLNSLNLSNFNTSLVTNMGYMFSKCFEISSLYLSNFNTSKVTYMGYMFYHCRKLTSLDLSNFDTSIVTYMGYMFNGCSNLFSLDLSNFDTSLVTGMDSMFKGCLKLSYINLKNFIENISLSVNNIFDLIQDNVIVCLNNNSKKLLEEIFKINCYTIDCSDNWQIKQKKKVDKRNICWDDSNNDILYRYEYNGKYYKYCINGTLYNNHTINNCTCDKEKCLSCPNEPLKEDFCTECNNNYYKIENDNNSYIEGYFKCYNNLTGYYLDNNTYKKCYYSCKECENKGDIVTHNCLKCDDNYPFEIKINNYSNCYENCSYYYYFDDEKNYHCTINLICPDEYPKLVYNECIKINETTIITEDIGINNQNIIASSEIEYHDTILKNIETKLTSENYNISNIDTEFYLYKNELIYKKCYYTCKECEIIGNNKTHNCLKCEDNYPFEIKINNYLNCYENCSYYYYFDDENNYHCTFISNCPDNYPKLLLERKECVKNNKIKDLIENLIKNETTEQTKEKEIEYYDTIIKNIEEGFTSDKFDTSDLDNGKDEIIETGKITVTFTTTNNQKNNNNNNMTSIDLGECELLLRQFYNLTNNETLYIKKLDIKQEGMKIPKIEYDVYSKLNGLNLIKLNLSVCQNVKISLSVPVDIKDNLDIFNSSSGYYNDICYTTTSESGTDISLEDRKNEYSNNTVCQDDCVLSSYNYTTQKATCSCDVKESSSSVADMSISKNNLLKNFKDIKNIANINILTCIDQLFCKENIIKNIGFYLILFIVIISIICLIVFYLCQSNNLKMKINEIAFAIKISNLLEKNDKNNDKNEIKLENMNTINNDFEEINNNCKISFKKKIDIKKKIIETQINISDVNDINNNIINNNILRKKKKRKKKRKNNKLSMNDGENNMFDSEYNKGINQNNSQEENPKLNDEFENMKKIMDYTGDELNDLPFDLALLHDKRTYCQYYLSLIKTKHNLIFSFFYNQDYNSKIIKIDLFFIGIASNYAINALFFDDDTMHNIYVNKGLFDIEYELPKIIYSSIISLIFDTILKILALSNDDIIEFKKNREKNDLNERTISLNKKLRIKFIIYFIFSFILLLFFWYYISMFGSIYRNTQYHLLKDTLISFGLSLVYPFGIYILQGFFRIVSLSDPNKRRVCLYKFGKIFDIF